MRVGLWLGVMLFCAASISPPLAALVFAQPAFAQMDSREAIALQNQILDLRRQLQQLSDQIARGGGSSLGGGYAPPPPPPASGGATSDLVAQLLDRVSSLEDQVRRLQGQVDEANNARQRAIDDLTKQIGDLNFRLQNGGGAQNGGGVGVAPPRPVLAPPAAAPTGEFGEAPTRQEPPPVPPAVVRRTPELIMQEGNAALARRDYPAAAAAAKEALAGPRTPRSTDAQFLLAQALMGERDFGQAALAYSDAYNRNRAGLHAPDALLGLANAMLGLGDRAASCQAVEKLHAEFPTPRPDVREAESAARARAGCR